MWQVDSALASDKTLELDAALGSQSVQYKEVQGQETRKFLSYFKPCIIPVEGVYSSGQVKLKGPDYETRLLTCKGDRVVHVKEVSFYILLIKKIKTLILKGKFNN